jgi:hypothetical protein
VPTSSPVFTCSCSGWIWTPPGWPGCASASTPCIPGTSRWRSIRRPSWPDAVALLIDTLGQVAGRSAKPDGQQRKLRVLTSDPDRQFTLETGDAVTLTPSDGSGPPELRLPAEAFIRLVYGRLDPAHTPPTDGADVDLDELRALFPGF